MVAGLSLSVAPTIRMTLSDKLVELTLNISDQTKTIDLLKNILSQLQGRHTLEVSKFEKNAEESLRKAASDNDDTLRDLFKANEELLKKKKDMESRVEKLTLEKQVSLLRLSSLYCLTLTDFVSYLASRKQKESYYRCNKERIS